MRRTPPFWTTTVTFLLAIAFLGFGVMCCTVPHLLFSSEGYRTVARGIIGMLGAMSMGLGYFTLLAVRKKKLSDMLAYLKVIIFALACGPAIALFNIGALEPIRQATGINVFVFVGINLFVFLCPAALAFFGLSNFKSRVNLRANGQHL